MFDYEALDEETRERLSLRARMIRPQMRRAAMEVVALGRSLAKAKMLLGHYGFGQWMLDEFQWSQEVSWRFLVTARRFDALPWTPEASYTALNMLVAPTAAESACFDALVRRALGQAMTEEVLRNIIIQRQARGLTVEDLAELTGIEIAPPPGDEVEEDEGGEEEDQAEEDEGDEEEDQVEAVEENVEDAADEGCSENRAHPGSRIAVRPQAD